MVKLSVLHWDLVVRVLLWQDLLMLYGLHSGMMVMLMSLTIHSLRDILVTGWLHAFAGNTWIYTLFNLRGMTVTPSELGDGFLCRLHDVLG
jgi:hypothetical protein